MSTPRSPAPVGDSADGDAESRRLLHQLQVHQIELEVQNEELQRARSEAEAALARYTELYDEAPVGYLTLDEEARIRQANPAAASLLATRVEALRGQRFADWIEHLDRPAWGAFLRRLVASGTIAHCELCVQRGDGEPRYLRLEGRCSGERGLCRIALGDVTGERLSTDALRRSETQLRSAYRQLAQAQEAERRRLTEQLHDQVGRNLTALGLNLSMLDDSGDALPPELRERLSDSVQLLQDTVTVVRGLMSELYPPMLVDYGLFAALRWWTGEIGKGSGIELRMLDADAGLRPPVETEIALFRIAQEAIANAVKHAGAKRIDVALRPHARGLRLEIADDGRGFEPPAAGAAAQPERSTGSHWGLTLMRERALAIGATMQIESAPGRGTRVVIDTEAFRR